MSERLEESAGRDESPARNPRVIAAAVLGAIIALFALLNTDDVKVNWVLGTWKTPLIIVIAVSVLIGAALDRAMVRRSRKRD